MPLIDLVDDSGDDADSAMDVVSMSQQLSEPQFPSASTSLFELHYPLPVPNLERTWQAAQSTLEPEKFRLYVEELVALQRYARARAAKLHKYLVEVANATNFPLQLDEKYEEWMDILRNTEITLLLDEITPDDANNVLSNDENASKRKREEKRRRDRDKKKKKKKRPGEEGGEAAVKPPDSLWTTTADYFRFPNAEDLELISPKIDDSLFEVPLLGKHFPDEWKIIDETRIPQKKKKKSYQTISRRFRPKSDIMAVTDINIRKEIIELDKHLKSQRSLQQMALSRRCIAAIFPLKKGIRIPNPLDSSLCPINSGGQIPRTAAPNLEANDPVDQIEIVPDFSEAPFAFADKAPDPGTPKQVPIIKSFFEERVRMELKYIGLLPTSKAKCADLAKPENRFDDEVAVYLRHLQEQLKSINAINTKRCAATLPKASVMIGLDRLRDRLVASEKNLEQLYKTMNTSSWDPQAATAAMDEYEKILHEWKNQTKECGTCGTFYIAKPEDFSGTVQVPKKENT